MKSLVKLIENYTHWLNTRWPAGQVERFPEVNPDGTTHIPEIRIAGDLTGVPLLKFAADSGAKAVQEILDEPDFKTRRGSGTKVIDLAIIGAGIAGIAAAIEAKNAGLNLKVFEAKRPFIFSVISIAILLLISGVMLSGTSCSEAKDQQPGEKGHTAEEFEQFWFQGLSEISRFELEQARYGEIHKGDAVLIYVTEEFLIDKHVKSEQGKKPGAVSVLKLNFNRKFNTGIYPYSVMSSIFTPVDRQSYPQSLKVTTSIQEWCGHTFTQLNFRKNKYNVLLRSYFMDEGDQQYLIEPVQLEDDIWTLIRIEPSSLPTGDIRLIPGSQFSRLKHIKQEIQKATATLREADGLYIYAIKYAAIPRTLTIKFKKAFPYEIMAWEETSAKDKSVDGELLTTRAVRTNIMHIDYWNKKSVEDLKIRKKLGLK